MTTTTIAQETVGEKVNPIVEYADCYDRVKELEREMKEEKAKLEALEELALRQFTEAGEELVRLSDGTTVYIHRDTRLSLVSDEDGTKETAHRVLRKRGLSYMVKNNVNLQTLRSWYTTQVKEENPIHPEVMEVLKVSEIDSVRVSHSRAKGKKRAS